MRITTFVSLLSGCLLALIADSCFVDAFVVHRGIHSTGGLVQNRQTSVTLLMARKKAAKGSAGRNPEDDIASAKKAALDGVLQQIERSYGRGSIVRLGDADNMVVDSIGSGSLTLGEFVVGRNEWAVTALSFIHNKTKSKPLQTNSANRRREGRKEGTNDIPTPTTFAFLSFTLLYVPVPFLLLHGCTDAALGGGYPKGRVIEIYGPESSGKTTLALHAIADVQKNGGIGAFIDAEHALDPAYAANLGVDTDSLMVSQPDSGEMALDIVDQLVRSSAVDVIVVDSVAALVPRAELEGDMSDQQIGLQARLMSKAMRKITGSLALSQCTVIFLNQLRSKASPNHRSAIH